MPWRDNLRAASFRGVPFYYTSVTSAVGRRTVVHKFPGRDDAEVEDLGRDAAEFTIDAYVLGDNYMAERDRLIAAFEKAGAGDLVHPYWGTRRVAVTGKIRITESTREGGLARFSVPVIEAGLRVASAAVTVDTASRVNAAADAAVDSAKDAFADAHDMADVIEAAIDNATAAVNSGLTLLRKIKGNINAALNLVDDGLAAIQTVAEFTAAIIRLPVTLANTVTGLVAQVMASVSTIEESVADLIALGGDQTLPYSDGATSQKFRSQILMAAWREMDAFDADGATVLGSGTQATIEDSSLDGIIRIFRTASAIETARAISEITFDSFDRAFATLEEMTAALDELATATSDDVEYRTLVDLRSALALHIQSTAADLPRIVEVTPAETTPALVLAQELYGDAAQAEDIIARNGVRNPTGIPGGEALEVLAGD